MIIAVSGATGFIGKMIIPLLINEGHKVLAIVRDSSKLPDFGFGCVPIEFEIGRDLEESILVQGMPDVLIHLAWGGLPNYQSLHHIEREFPMQYQFVKRMVTLGIKNVTVTGTCFEYGMQSGRLSEDTLVRQTNPYGFAKFMLCCSLGFLQGELPFSLTWLRLFYMYGDEQPENTLYSKFKNAVKQGERVFNMSGGEQLRDYLHINEVAKGIVSLALKQQDLGIVNICSGNPISVRGIVEMWRKACDAKIELQLGYYPYPDYEAMAFWGDNTKLLRLLGR